MPNVRVDTVDNSSFIQTGNSLVEISRGFVIDGIDTSIEPVSLTTEAIPILATYTSASDPAGISMGFPHPARPDALLSRIEIQGLLQDAISGRLIYSTLTGITPTAYVLTRSTRLVQEQASILPNGQIITCQYDADGTPEDHAKLSVPIDYVTMNFLRPCTVLTASGVRLGPPNYPGADYVGYVNQNFWGGRAKGNWLIAEFTTAWSKYQGYHEFRCSVQAFINGKDWSTFGILENRLTGKKVYYPGMQGYIFTSVTDAYDFSSDIGSYGSNGFGFTHVGGYPTIDFGSIGL